MSRNITAEMVKDAYQRNNYTFFENGDLNLNLFGIRTDNDDSNTFNDLIGLCYKENDIWQLKTYAATTDPGLYYREHPMNVNGTGILAPGQYAKAFRLGKHRGQYDALVQNVPFNLYRDNNKDAKLDMVGTPNPEMAGINLHRATGIPGKTSVQVDKWSAGCQVIASYDDFAELMSVVQRSAKKYGNTFTYTLFTEQQFYG